MSDFLFNLISFLDSNISCSNCKWCKSGGEFENDECHNNSMSGHLESGTLVADDFWCNRWEGADV